LVATPTLLKGQAFTGINRALEDGEYAKAKQKLEKRLVKDPRDLEALYIMSEMYVTAKDTSYYDLDSAYFYVLASITVFVNETDPKKIHHYKVVGISGKSLENLKSEIQREGFVEAREKRTYEAYGDYLERFGPSPYYRQIRTVWHSWLLRR
jgi:hypothetical protein